MVDENQSAGLYLDDLEEGQKFVSNTYVVERDRMLAFATEFDPQPFHLADSSSMIDGLAASGWFTAAITHQLMTTGGFPLASGMIGLSVDVSWPMATRAGDVLRVETSVKDIQPSRSKPDRGVVTIYSETLNDRDAVVQRQTAKIMVMRGQ
jgi:acyl dehydratase